MNWKPTQPNGWYPALNYPWVAYGFGECYLSNMVTGSTVRLHPEVRTQPAGWLNPQTLVFYCGEAPATIYAYDLLTGTERVLGVRHINRVVARAGHWATGYAADGVVTYDGREVGRNAGWRVDICDTLVASQSNAGLHIWLDGVAQPVVTPKTTLVDPRCGNGAVGYGYNGPARLYFPTVGQDLEVTVTTPPKEHAPLYLNGMVWSTTERAEGGSLVLGRPIGQPVTHTVARASAIYLDAQQVGSDWVIATSGDQGQLVVSDVAGSHTSRPSDSTDASDEPRSARRGAGTGPIQAQASDEWLDHQRLIGRVVGRRSVA